MGQVINVEEKKVKVPDEQITLDDFIDDSEDFLSQYEEDSEPDPRNEGTTWISGHRISLRPQHRSQNKELFSQVFRSMVAEAKSKQEKSHLLRSLHACLEELQQQKKIDQIMFKQIRNKVISKFINNSELHAKFEDIKKYVMMQVVSMNPKLLSTKLTRKANSQLEKTEIEIE
ncbi:hypothetical protein GPJ56_009784 [Histomonas meleagridis]|uniref:uncharacterized protein n=1 Tax=Histomonas meleagridis TaxID=135588 RepID=UPI00355A9836|nr:hypothetical protein GPJ56_009784 [Histomonas meleagridis]KAH0798799.1 hypothetical protein GO595_008664 [Histomonas meleagridis]